MTAEGCLFPGLRVRSQVGSSMRAVVTPSGHCHHVPWSSRMYVTVKHSLQGCQDSA